MSGQPNQTPLDASKFRQAYMANLNMRIALDDKNLQANKTYNRTGQLPVEPSDFRTTEEKLADVLRLRVDVRNQLGKITDGPNANKISVELTPNELVFYYQQSPVINQLIKERYSKGVLANLFIPFLQKYMVDSLANKGVASGLQQVSAPNLLLSGENIARALATQPDYLGLFESYMDTGISIAKPITDAINVLPPTDLFQKINAVTDENEKFKLLEEATNYLKDLPSKNELSMKIREIQRLKNIKDTSGLKGETDRVIQLITPSADTKIQMNNILKGLQKPSAEIIPDKPTYPFEMKEFSGYTPLSGGDEGGEEGVDESGEPEKPPVIPEKKSKSGKKTINIGDTVSKVMDIDDLIALSKDEQMVILDEIEKLNLENLSAERKKATPLWGSTSFYTISRTEADRGRKEILKGKLIQLKNNEYTRDYLMGKIGELQTKYESMKGSGVGNPLYMVGKGVVVINKPKRYDMIKKSDIDTSMGVEKTPRYIPFGRYFINRNRLNDGVVSIKRPSGGAIVEFPSQRVSTPLTEVLKKIVGKGVPAFEDLEALTEEEKLYLHKLAKESHIIDRISIPTPKKGETDKDLNRFEILKGQITSGNDNKELIKEFKMLIMKLSGLKIIPKSQARDILFDLTSMGY